MAQYMATPHSLAGSALDIALSIGLKTILQVGVPTATEIEILGWGISIAGTAAGDVPYYAALMEGDVAASVGTSLTPDAFSSPGAQASLCIGGAALTSYAPSPGGYTEGTINTCRFFDTQRVHPQTGYSVWFPSDARPVCGLVASARFVRIRINAVTTAYNVIPWIVWNE